MAEPKTPMDGFTYADNPYNSPLRQWFYEYLSKEFPTNDKVYRSDSENKGDRQKFTTWTGMTQESIMEMWKSKARFSTCTGFVAVLVTRIRQSGGLKASPVFQTFDLALNKKGWHRYPDPSKEPDVGDIFVLGSPGYMKHVGVILNSIGNQWVTIEAGGGTIGQFQSIKRAGWHTPDYANLYGWIDIDEYFDAWSNPKYQ